MVDLRKKSPQFDRIELAASEKTKKNQLIISLIMNLLIDILIWEISSSPTFLRIAALPPQPPGISFSIMVEPIGQIHINSDIKTRNN